MSHPDKHLFQPVSNAANTRQAIWSLMMKDPLKEFSLGDLSEAIKAGYANIYAAAKSLVRAGLAERINAEIPAPSKKNPERKKKVLFLRVIEPWKPSKKGSWDA